MVNKMKKKKSLIAEIEKVYGKDFGEKNMDTVGDYFIEMGYPSLDRLLRGTHGKIS
jgi:hypothetical protein